MYKFVRHVVQIHKKKVGRKQAHFVITGIVVPGKNRIVIITTSVIAIISNVYSLVKFRF